MKKMFPLFFLAVTMIAASASSSFAQKGVTPRQNPIAIYLECSESAETCVLKSMPDTASKAVFSPSNHITCPQPAPGLNCTIVMQTEGCAYVGFKRKMPLPYLALDRRTPDGYGKNPKEAALDCPTCIFESFGCGQKKPAAPQV